MTLLRRTLQVQAAVWAGCGFAIAAIPKTVLRDWFDQPPYIDYAYVRVAGILSIGMALLMVLVSQRLMDVWWWTWAFIITTAGLVTLAVVNVLFGLPRGAGALLWWLFAGVNAVLLVALLVGMARAEQEKPFA